MTDLKSSTDLTSVVTTIGMDFPFDGFQNFIEGCPDFVIPQPGDNLLKISERLAETDCFVSVDELRDRNHGLTIERPKDSAGYRQRTEHGDIIYHPGDEGGADWIRVTPIQEYRRRNPVTFQYGQTRWQALKPKILDLKDVVSIGELGTLPESAHEHFQLRDEIFEVERKHTSSPDFMMIEVPSILMTTE